MGIEDQFMQLFIVEEEGNRLPLWDEWISRLERLMSIKSITDDKQKQNFLFFFGGSDLEKVYKKKASDNDTYKNVKQKITESFKAKYNSQVSKVHFRDMYQFEGEPFEDFVNR
ncbi:unnamed protein product [Brachionus calyciflorus]|uniref:Uncharacterized protein n=1 Tax=Brachionus calyciflorus TaxID=104777 RepID=A0A814GMZ1_9BILA|nr:unnamed protein product [Brachionus calyciflorus]